MPHTECPFRTNHNPGPAYRGIGRKHPADSWRSELNPGTLREHCPRITRGKGLGGLQSRPNAQIDAYWIGVIAAAGSSHRRNVREISDAWTAPIRGPERRSRPDS